MSVKLIRPRRFGDERGWFMETYNADRYATLGIGVGLIFACLSNLIVAAVPAGHPLAERSRVTLRDLSAHPIACMPPGTGLPQYSHPWKPARFVAATSSLRSPSPAAIAAM